MTYIVLLGATLMKGINIPGAASISTALKPDDREGSQTRMMTELIRGSKKNSGD